MLDTISYQLTYALLEFSILLSSSHHFIFNVTNVLTAEQKSQSLSSHKHYRNVYIEIQHVISELLFWHICGPLPQQCSSPLVSHTASHVPPGNTSTGLSHIQSSLIHRDDIHIQQTIGPINCEAKEWVNSTIRLYSAIHVVPCWKTQNRRQIRNTEDTEPKHKPEKKQITQTQQNKTSLV